MPERSASSELTRRFLLGETTRAENADAVRGLLIGDESAAESWPAADEAALDAVFDRVTARLGAEEARLEDERRKAAELAEEIESRLDAGTLAEVDAEVRRSARFHSLALSEALRVRSFDTGLDDPERAVSLARLAARVAELATTEASRSRLDHDFLAAAWGQVGNALRIASQLRQSEAAFKTAHAHRDQGTDDPLVHARLLGFEASLDRDRSRLRDGILRCRKAGRLFRRAGDVHGQGRMLILEAGLHVEACDVPTAIACLDRAAARVNGASEPRLALVALHNLVSYLDHEKRYDDAWKRLGEARRLARRLGHRLDLVRLRWLEGRIAYHRGDAEHAETCWNEARGTFVELGVPYDAALVSLEMAALLEGQGRRAELGRLVDEMLPIFRSQSLHREAQTALRIFSDAVRAEAAEIVDLAREVVDYLEKARDRPGVPFRTSKG